ncbi:MAG: hypothetical protein AAF589_06330 [Planctomycetota bacterium]
MSIFTDYEQAVIELLLHREYSCEEVSRIFAGSELVSVEHTGCGYFLTAKHALFPTKRVVCDSPWVEGKAGGIHCGFVAFLEGGELLIDCHGMGTPDMPLTVREMDLAIRWKPDSKVTRPLSRDSPTPPYLSQTIIVASFPVRSDPDNCGDE